jgi:hypothetical protein
MATYHYFSMIWIMVQPDIVANIIGDYVVQLHGHYLYTLVRKGLPFLGFFFTVNLLQDDLRWDFRRDNE